MSCYAWEHGTIKLPRAAVVTVRAAVVDRENERRKETFDRAVAILPRLLALGKGKRGFDFRKAFEGFAESERLGEDDHGIKRLLFVDVRRPLPRVGYMGVTEMWETVKAPKPKAPKKSALVLLKARGKQRLVVELGEASITFDGQTVTWDVPENNHAPERAHEDPVAVALFRALDRVQWTRGSGGEIAGNDEYGRDSQESGGGGNYTVANYGPGRGAMDTIGRKRLARRVQVVHRWG